MKARILVKGRVQNVGYRNFVRLMANHTSIMGAVRNLKNGTVEIFAEGGEKNFENFLDKIKPKNARITRAAVESVEIVTEGSQDFQPPWKSYGNKFLIDKKTYGN